MPEPLAKSEEERSPAPLGRAGPSAAAGSWVEGRQALLTLPRARVLPAPSGASGVTWLHPKKDQKLFSLGQSLDW